MLASMNLTPSTLLNTDRKWSWFSLLSSSVAAAAAASIQSCPTLCDPIDGSPPGSLVPGILQARTLEWVAISFSNAWKWKVKVKSLSCVWVLATPWTAAYQAPLPMGFSRQEYWSGLPLCIFSLGKANCLCMESWMFSLSPWISVLMLLPQLNVRAKVLT